MRLLVVVALLCCTVTWTQGISLRHAAIKEIGKDLSPLLRPHALLARRARSLSGGGPGPVDGANGFGPEGSVDAFLDDLVDQLHDDSSEDLDYLLEQLHEEIRTNPDLDVATMEEQLAELQEQLTALTADVSPPPPTPAPINLEEAAAEAAEQLQSQQQQADTGGNAVDTADVAQPDPPQPSQSGPDGSNTEDGDGHGNNNNADTGASAGGGAEKTQPEAAAGGGAEAAPPADPAPTDPVQTNALDSWNEDTKS